MLGGVMNPLVNTTQAPTSLEPVSLGLMEDWINFLDVRPKTAQTYTRNIKPFAEYMQKKGITNPTRADIIAYRNELEAPSAPGEEPKKPATVQAYIMAIKQFFKWTETQGLYPNIAKNIKGATISQEHKKDPLTMHQVEQVLSSFDRETPKGKRDYAIFALMLTCGLRTIEVIRADIEDLRTVADHTALFLRGKGRDEKSEYVKVPHEVEDAIRDYLGTRENLKANSPLFASVANRNNGERLTTRSISRIVKESFRGVSLDSERLTAHSLRHTTATINLLNGGSIEETQQLLRHSNINTTMIYNHAISRMNNNSEDRIAGVIFK
jgi:integrase/recombinase XerD